MGCSEDHQAAGELGHMWSSPFVPPSVTAAAGAPTSAGGAIYGMLKGKHASCKISYAKLVGNGTRINKKKKKKFLSFSPELQSLLYERSLLVQVKTPCFILVQSCTTPRERGRTPS